MITAFGQPEVDDPEELRANVAPVVEPVVPVEAPSTPNKVISVFGGEEREDKQSFERGMYPEMYPVKISQDDIVNDPERLEKVRNYMSKRMDKAYETKSAEDVVYEFVEHMRWMNTNEVSTIGEARDILTRDEETRKQFGDAYKVYDELGSFLTNDGVGGAIDGLWDYTAATVSSPSTWLGGIVGRVAGRAATKAAQKTLISATARSVEAAVTKSAGQAAGVVARREVIKAGAKRSALVTTAASGVTDGVISGGANLLYQDVMIRTGVQDEVDYMQAGLSALIGGGVGGAVAYVPELTRSGSQLAGAADKITTAKRTRAAKASQAAIPEIEKAVKRVAIDWQEMAAKGAALDVNSAKRSAARDWFFDYNNADSLISILQRAGADLKTGDDATLSSELVAFAKALPDEVQEKLTKSLAPLNLKFGEFVDVFSRVMQEGGQSLNSASAASKFFSNNADITVARDKATGNILASAAEETEELVEKDLIGYTTSVWKRLLVSSPATTLANVKGWGWATAVTQTAQTLHALTLGATGTAKAVLSGGKYGLGNLAQADALFKNQIFMARTTLDPYTLVETFSEQLNRAPSRIKKDSLSSFFGGIRDEKPSNFGMNDKGAVVSKVEKAAEIAARISLVRTQDIYTKAITGMAELDKQIRLKFGAKTGYEELLNTGRTHEITDEMWEATSQSMLRDTFSVNYTRGKDPLSKMAKIAEEVGNIKGVGFIFPFARFMNNILGFTITHSPLAAFNIASKIKREGLTMGVQDKISRATIGTVALATVLNREAEKEKEGLQWYQERGPGGEVSNVQNLFPLSLYNLLGRMGHMVNSGQGISKEMKAEFLKQAGTLSMASAMSDISVIDEMVKTISDVSATNEEESNEWFKFIGSVAATLSGSVLSGFTRPLDPLNDMVGVAGEFQGVVDDRLLDRKQAEGTDAILQNFSRYTNHFFNLLAGEEDEQGRRFYGEKLNVATQDQAARQANPIASMFGNNVEGPVTNFDRLLGMVNKPPFKVNSFSGNPQYDDFVNDHIFPLLERRAKALLASPAFQKATPAGKADIVNKLIDAAKNELKQQLEENRVGGTDARLLDERRKLLLLGTGKLAEAKKALDISTPDSKLSMYEIEAIRNWNDVEQDFRKSLVE